MLFLVAMVCFIVYHFYIDYSNWSNTGNTFSEGMTSNVCMTEDSCKKVAESLGLKIGGGGYAFGGSYSTKGLYAYNSGNYSGMAFFGKGGTEAQMKQPINHPKYRPTPPPAATDEKVPQKGTFISNEGKEWKNQIPFKVSKNIYVFGGSDGGWFKMASVDSNGNFIENRHTNDCNSIDELTIEIWNSARRGGDYKVKDIIFVPTAPQQSTEATTAVITDATSCSGWDCEIEGQFCPMGVPGASAGNFLCKDKKWVKVAGRQAAPVAPTTHPTHPNNLNRDQVLSRTTNSRAGINTPMESNVPENCKPGCIAPTGPFANCKNITQEGQPKKSCPYTCFNPTLEPNKCQYEQDCNACGIKIFNPDDEPNMDPKQPNMVPEQPYMDPKQPSFAGQQADIPNGSPQATTLQTGQVNTSVQPNNPSWGTKTDGIQSTQSLATQSGNNTLFNEKIMTTVLANKNLIPSDINITLDKQSNFIRIAKGFMQDLSNIRNVALPNIDNNDFELLGRVIAKIKIQENEKITGPQNDVMKKQLINSVNNILAGTTISNSQVDWESPRTTAKMSTTGMYNDNGNSMLGYGAKATKHHSEKSENGLCLWKGCEKNEKGKPYDSVYSLY